MLPDEPKAPKPVELPAPDRSREEFGRVDHGEVRAIVRDVLKRMTFNDYPIDLEGSNIRVATRAMGVGVQESQPAPQLATFGQGAQDHTTMNHSHSERSIVDPRFVDDKGHFARNPARGGHTFQADPTTKGATLVPVRLQRGDGLRTIIAYIDVPTGYVVSGATTGERSIALPASDKFYDAQGNYPPAFWVEDVTTPTSGPKIRIRYGEVNNIAPSGMSPSTPYIIAVSGTQEVWLHAVAPTNDYALTTLNISSGGTIPADTGTAGYWSIASVVAAGDGLSVAVGNNGKRFNVINATGMWIWW